MTASIEDRLRALSELIRAAEADLTTSQAERHAVMREALAGGMSAYRVAQICGVTQRTVQKVRDAA